MYSGKKNDAIDNLSILILPLFLFCSWGHW